SFALRDWRDVGVGARIERRTAAGENRETTADRRLLKSGSRAQGIRHLISETAPRSDVGILRLRGSRQADPKIVRLETGILVTQRDETGDEQRRAREQRHRERHLRANEQFAETL